MLISAHVFNSAKEEYQEALNNSGHKYTLEMEAPEDGTSSTPTDSSRPKRKVIWYTPPFNQALKTKIGKRFLELVRKHFPPGHKLYSILNKNTLKISYSTTPNIKSIMQGHNKKLLRGKEKKGETKECSCRVKNQCPLENKCIQQDVIYQATVDEPNPKKYIGSTQDFKSRFYSHQQSFRDPTLQNSTALSDHIWENNLAPNPSIKWEIIAHAPRYNKGGRYCQLCLTEKAIILANSTNPTFINKRSEIAQKCRHRAAYKLSRVKPKGVG